MNSGGRKFLSVALLLFVFFSLLFPAYQGNPALESNGKFLSYPGILYLEYLQLQTGGTGLAGEPSRHVLQSETRAAHRMLSMRAPDPFCDETVRVTCTGLREIGVLCMMVFLTIIVYIFRTDGKKRFVN